MKKKKHSKKNSRFLDDHAFDERYEIVDKSQ